MYVTRFAKRGLSAPFQDPSFVNNSHINALTVHVCINAKTVQFAFAGAGLQAVSDINEYPGYL